MRILSSRNIALAVGLTAAAITFIASAGADDEPLAAQTGITAEAVFAGGCFWCVESDFDKVDGVLDTISGYTGGTLDNPTYDDVTYGDTGHYEVVKIVYDPARVSYDELLDYFWRHVDPTDAGGQFCDRGDSYRTAIFATTDTQKARADAAKLALEASGMLADPVVTPVLTLDTFYPAEDYHQDYYTRNPIRYRYYRTSCGRDRTIRKVWSGAQVEG